jgi:amidase
MIRSGETSSLELVKAHFAHIETINPQINAVVYSMGEAALREAAAADRKLAAGDACGPLHGVPFSVKDSIEVADTPCTAGTVGFRNAPPSRRDATLVARLRKAGGIPLCKTNLPDLLFSFESDNLLFGRTNNPYDVHRTSGGSSGGEAALLAACGSPLGLGSDCLGSVRLPAAFCGVTAIKPTSGRLPRTGHVPPAGGWVEKLWQIGPMARWTEDLVLAMRLLAGEDGTDFTSPPVPVLEPGSLCGLRAAFFVDNGIAACSEEVRETVRAAARHLAASGVSVQEMRPPCIEQSFELEMSILGADGGDGIDSYLQFIGSEPVHPLMTNFVERFRRYRGSATQLAGYWAQWDAFRAEMTKFFTDFDVVLSPVYPQVALQHGSSAIDSNFEGFSYTMTWSVAGFPAATVRCGEVGRLPVNVQVAAKPWHDLTALSVCRELESAFGGWQPPPMF